MTLPSCDQKKIITRPTLACAATWLLQGKHSVKLIRFCCVRIQLFVIIAVFHQRNAHSRWCYVECPSFFGQTLEIGRGSIDESSHQLELGKASICNHTTTVILAAAVTCLLITMTAFQKSVVDIDFNCLFVLFPFHLEWLEFYNQRSGTICQRTSSTLLQTQ